MQSVHVSVTVPSEIVQLPSLHSIVAFSALPPFERYFLIVFESAVYAASPATLPPAVASAAPTVAASSAAPLDGVSITSFS